EGLDPEGHRDTVTESKLGSAFFADAGLPSAVPVGAFFDLFPVSVMTTATLDQLKELRPESRFAAPRFGMNVIAGTRRAGLWRTTGSVTGSRSVITYGCRSRCPTRGA